MFKNEWKNIEQVSGIEPGSPEDKKLPFEHHPWKNLLNRIEEFYALNPWIKADEITWGTCWTRAFTSNGDVDVGRAVEAFEVGPVVVTLGPRGVREGGVVEDSLNCVRGVNELPWLVLPNCLPARFRRLINPIPHVNWKILTETFWVI